MDNQLIGNTADQANNEYYRLFLQLDADSAGHLHADRDIKVHGKTGDGELYLKIFKQKAAPSGIGLILQDFKKLAKAIKLPLQSAAGRSKFFATSLVYIFLSVSGVSIFFIRGWRLGVIKRMADRNIGTPLCPEVHSLQQLGEYVKHGIRLIAGKAAYDLPKILILAAIGYDHFELILEWLHYFFVQIFPIGGMDPATAVGDLANSSVSKLSFTLGLQFIFLLIYSFFFTPAFRITAIKYAVGKIPFKNFFNWDEMKDSFRIYKRFKTTTMEAYVWDVLVSSLSYLAGFILLIMFPFISIAVIACYKLLFKHWPKAYGYGVLARRMRDNGEI